MVKKLRFDKQLIVNTTFYNDQTFPYVRTTGEHLTSEKLSVRSEPKTPTPKVTGIITAKYPMELKLC